MPRPFRRATLVAVAVLALGLLAWPAAASNGSHGFLSLFPPKPPKDAVATTVHIEQHGVDTDPAACGDYGVEWATNLQADVTTYRDAQGRRLQQKVEITEDNTVKNTVTGLHAARRPDPVHADDHVRPRDEPPPEDLHQRRQRARRCASTTGR